MTMVTTDGYGGLEHRASTAPMCARGDLPVRGNAETSEGYRILFLGLCSHEYFHLNACDQLWRRLILFLPSVITQ